MKLNRRHFKIRTTFDTRRCELGKTSIEDQFQSNLSLNSKTEFQKNELLY